MEIGWKPAICIGVLWVLGTACARQSLVRAPASVPTAFEQRTPDAPPGWPGQDWYRSFSSDELNDLVARAGAENLDLTMARARIAAADARARIAGAAILPSIDAQGNATYLAGHSSQGTAHETDWSALLSASYELDFWGRNRAAATSAQLLWASSKAEHDALALTTLAGVADAYFQVLALRERSDIAASNLDTARQLLAVVQARFDAGTASPIELASQKSALNSAALVIAELAQQEQEARGALALLVGHSPEGFEVKSQPLDSLTEPVVAPGMPVELLTRRPDISAAEANLRSADADVAAARAAMLPGVTLTAAGGVQNPALNAAVLSLPGTGGTLALGGSLVQTIFDHGRLKAQRAEAEARSEERLAAYRSAILAALSDTENALASIRHLDEARPFQVGLLAESERALAGAKLRYEAGSGDYLTLLETQRAYYLARDQAIQFKVARLQALVALCKALGGGWSEPSPDLKMARQRS